MSDSNGFNNEKEQNENRLNVIWPDAFNKLDNITIIPVINQKSVQHTLYINHYNFNGQKEMFEPPQV